MQIEYDNDKRLATLPRGVDFADFPLVYASRIFQQRDPFRKEKRWQVFGFIGEDMVFAVYVIRSKRPYAKNFRVLSMRKVGQYDRKRIEEKHQRQFNGE